MANDYGVKYLNLGKDKKRMKQEAADWDAAIRKLKSSNSNNGPVTVTPGGQSTVKDWCGNCGNEFGAKYHKSEESCLFGEKHGWGHHRGALKQILEKGLKINQNRATSRPRGLPKLPTSLPVENFNSLNQPDSQLHSFDMLKGNGGGPKGSNPNSNQNKGGGAKGGRSDTNSNTTNQGKGGYGGHSKGGYQSGGQSSSSKGDQVSRPHAKVPYDSCRYCKEAGHWGDACKLRPENGGPGLAGKDNNGPVKSFYQELECNLVPLLSQLNKFQSLNQNSQTQSRPNSNNTQGQNSNCDSQSQPQSSSSNTHFNNPLQAILRQSLGGNNGGVVTKTFNLPQDFISSSQHSLKQRFSELRCCGSRQAGRDELSQDLRESGVEEVQDSGELYCSSVATDFRRDYLSDGGSTTLAIPRADKEISTVFRKFNQQGEISATAAGGGNVELDGDCLSNLVEVCGIAVDEICYGVVGNFSEGLVPSIVWGKEHDIETFDSRHIVRVQDKGFAPSVESECGRRNFLKLVFRTPSNERIQQQFLLARIPRLIDQPMLDYIKHSRECHFECDSKNCGECLAAQLKQDPRSHSAVFESLQDYVLQLTNLTGLKVPLVNAIVAQDSSGAYLPDPATGETKAFTAVCYYSENSLVTMNQGEKSGFLRNYREYSDTFTKYPIQSVYPDNPKVAVADRSYLSALSDGNAALIRSRGNRKAHGLVEATQQVLQLRATACMLQRFSDNTTDVCIPPNLGLRCMKHVSWMRSRVRKVSRKDPSSAEVVTMAPI